MIPGHQNIVLKEQEKVDRYQEIKLQIQKMLNDKVKVIPVILGALGTVSHN